MQTSHLLPQLELEDVPPFLAGVLLWVERGRARSGGRPLPEERRQEGLEEALLCAQGVGPLLLPQGQVKGGCGCRSATFSLDAWHPLRLHMGCSPVCSRLVD